jgi:hypothetical protein
MTWSGGFPNLVVYVVDAASAAQDNKPQTVTRATTATNQLQIPVIEEEEPFQLSPRNRTRELRIHRYLVITEKLNWHDTNVKPTPKA